MTTHAAASRRSPNRPTAPRRLIGAGAAAALLLGLAAWAQEQPAPTPPADQPPAEIQPEPAPPGPAPPAAAVAVPPADEPRETELILSDQQRVTGVLVDANSTSVVLMIDGVRTTFPAAQVQSRRALPTVEERYAVLRSAIDDGDADALLNLARWLRDRKRYGLALREASRVLEIEPTNPQANELAVYLREQIKLEAIKRERTATRDPSMRPVGPLVGPRPAPQQRETFPLLTDEQMNLLRVFEVDLRDPPAMIIRRKTAERLLEKYGGQIVQGRGVVPVAPEAREQFLRQKPAEILSWMFDLRAREFYPEVEVLENPRSLRAFRDNVHRTWLMNSCATTRCHGGEEAGRLYLYNRKQGSDRSALTNFLIIERFRTTSGDGLINYREPARSILLQMGLPREQAAYPHPEVKGVGKVWKPAFDSPDDPRFRDAVRWISLMYPNRTDYPIDFRPPVPGPLETTPPESAGPR
ncbi:MAG TPA: hypothetical protein VD971_06155 [Phycisphaerales bacterium]|nr:hypothetical protein [Phycisphaerales bacterium]